MIGAGPAGLTAAYELLKQSEEYSVLVLEAGETIGGISKTINCDGNRMDMGGHRFFSKDPRINAWWEEILPLQGTSSEADTEQEDAVMLVRKRVSHIFYDGKYFDYPVKMNFRTVRNMGFCLTLKAGLSFLKTRFKKLPETSLENFYINRFGKKLYQMFFYSYTYKLWGRHPKEISADWGAQRVKGLSITEVLKHSFGKLFSIRRKNVETSLIEEFWYPKYGPGQLWETVADRVEQMGGVIWRNCTVDHLELESQAEKDSERRIRKLSCVCGGELREIEADVVFSTMPLNNLLRGIKNVPVSVRNIAEGLPYRDFVTVGVLVRREDCSNLNHGEDGQSAPSDCWIYVQDPNVTMGRIQIFNNWSPYMVKDSENTIWMGLEYFCQEGDADWNRSEEEWIAHAVSELKTMHMIAEKAVIWQSHCEKVQKAYPAYFDTYSQMDELVLWLDQITNLYCIGRNGQHRYNNMDHSMLTAMEAVRHLLLKTGEDREKIWKVNTEQSYHEERSRESD